MTTQVISDINFNDPGNLIPFLEKDDAIIRGVTKSLIDFSNPASYSGGSAAIPAGTLITSLTSDGQAVATGSTLPPMSGGLVDFGGSSKGWQLPANFKLPNTCKRFMVILWAKLPGSGYQTVSGNVTQSLLGVMDNAGNLAQWGFELQTIQASGLPLAFGYLTPTSGSTVTQRMLTNADTLAVCDGNLHQLAMYFDGESSPGNAFRQCYVDKVLKDSGNSAWDGSFNVPAATPKLGVSNAFQTSVPVGFRLGRSSMWDLSGTAWTPAQIVQRDWDAAQGYLS